MDQTRQVMRRMLAEARDVLTLRDIHDYNTGKSVLVNDVWYTVRRQDKDKDAFLLSVADFEPKAGDNETWVPFQTILDKVNAGEWGFQHKDESRGRQGWFGKESPRHEGRHDIS